MKMTTNRSDPPPPVKADRTRITPAIRTTAEHMPPRSEQILSLRSGGRLSCSSVALSTSSATVVEKENYRCMYPCMYRRREKVCARARERERVE